MIDSLSKLLLWKPTSAVCSSLHQLYSSSSTNSQAGIVQLLCTSVLGYYQLVHQWFHSWFTCLIIISYYLFSNKLLLKVFFFKNSPRSLISTQGQFLFGEIWIWFKWTQLFTVLNPSNASVFELFILCDLPDFVFIFFLFLSSGYQVVQVVCLIHSDLHNDQSLTAVNFLASSILMLTHENQQQNTGMLSGDLLRCLTIQ